MQTLDDKRDRIELTIRIVSLEESAYLNKKYRKKKKVLLMFLSFVSEGVEKIAPDFLGDLVVCAPVVNKRGRPAREKISKLIGRT